MAKVTITSIDPIHYQIYDTQESADLFGSDYTEEFGMDISDELLAEYKQAYDAFWKNQQKIEKLMKGK